MQPYAPRMIRSHGIRQFGAWRLRVHSVVVGASPVDWDAFAAGFELALADLPQPAVGPGRPGVGFLIAHQGRTGNYAVLGWWDRENELPLRIFVSPDGSASGWRRNAPDESICVWDLEVIAAERAAYIRTLLTPGGGGTEAYLHAS